MYAILIYVYIACIYIYINDRGRSDGSVYTHTHTHRHTHRYATGICSGHASTYTYYIRIIYDILYSYTVSQSVVM